MMSVLIETCENSSLNFFLNLAFALLLLSTIRMYQVAVVFQSILASVLKGDVGRTLPLQARRSS